MTTETKQNEVTNFEATSDGKRVLHRNNGSKDSGNIRRENTKSTLTN